MSEQEPTNTSTSKKLLFIGVPVFVVAIIALLVFSFVAQTEPAERPNAIPTLSDLTEEQLLDSTTGEDNSNTTDNSENGETNTSENGETSLPDSPDTTPGIRPELSEETLATIALGTDKPFETALQEESFFNDNPYRVYVLNEELTCPTNTSVYKFYKTTIQETAIYPTVQNSDDRWGEFIEIEKDTPICIRETLGESNSLTNLTVGSEVPGRVLVEVIAETNAECLQELEILEPEINWTVIKIDNEYGFCTGLAVMLSEEKITEILNSEEFVSAEKDTIVSIQ